MIFTQLNVIDKSLFGKVLEKGGIWYVLGGNALFGGFLVDFLIKIGDRIVPK